MSASVYRPPSAIGCLTGKGKRGKGHVRHDGAVPVARLREPVVSPFYPSAFSPAEPNPSETAFMSNSASSDAPRVPGRIAGSVSAPVTEAASTTGPAVSPKPVPSAPDIASGRLPGDAIERAFAQHYPPLTDHEARVEADRCYFCHDAPCVTACPTGIDVPLFIRQIATGNREGAGKTIFESNILGGTCARVCPTEVLCQGACVRMVAEDKPVLIGLLQRYATDAFLAPEGRAPAHPFERAEPNGKSVAVVGAGPAGLACAHELARHGVEVTILDANPKPGGLNEYGIAAYKEVGAFAQEEVEFVSGIGGIEIEHDKALGRDVSLDDLKAGYDAVFLGIGLPGTNDWDLGEGGNVHDAVDYIARLRQSDDPSTLPVGRRVVVIGGGMTAVDIACQTRLLGAEDVTIAYRRGEERMNASPYERDHARRLGVSIRTRLAPVSLRRGEDGAVTGVEFDYAEERDGTLALTGDRIVLPADQVFLAIGQTMDGPFAGSGLVEERGRLRVDGERRTSDPKVWAGGDCARTGDELTVVAVEDGKVAARSMLRAMGVA